MKKNVYNLIRPFGIAHLILLTALSCFSEKSLAQTTADSTQTTTASQYHIMPTIINGNFTTQPGIYLIDKNVLVGQTGVLQITAGTEILFKRNTRIDVKGGLKIEGTASNRVKITSEKAENPGKGFVITEAVHQQSVWIKNADFSHLTSPITFQINWVRSEVTITHNTFLNNETSRAVIELQGVDPFLSKTVVPVNIQNNTFSNNSGNLFVSNIATQEMRVNVSNNVFTRNQFYNQMGSALFRNPLFIRYNEFGLEVSDLINNNSIFDNFYTPRNDSSLTSKRASLNVVGTGPRLNLTGNYLGNPKNEELALTMENSGAFFKMPYIEFEAGMVAPPKNVNGHVYEIKVNGRVISQDEQWIALDQLSTVTLKFNRPVLTNQLTINQFSFMGSSFEKTEIEAEATWSNNNTELTISLSNALASKKGFLTIDGITDENGTPVPSIAFGKKRYALTKSLTYSVGAPLKKEYIRQSDYALFPTLADNDNSQEEDDSSEKEKEEEAPKDLAPGRWEIGFYAGMPIYFGDLFEDYPLVLDPLHTGQRAIFSPRIQYNKTGSKWTYEGRLNAFLLEGADNKEGRVGEYRGTGYSRNLSFRTIVVGLSAVAHYDFRNPRTIKKWIPGFHGGIDVFYYQPQGQYNGKWYDLRSLGTEGQTINGKSDEYFLVSAGVPLGFHFNRYFNHKWKIAFSFTYTYTFTDYLDDVGGGEYPDADALREANPGKENIAVRLSNPSGSKGVRSNGSINDAYAFWGIGIYYNLQPKK